MFALSFIHSEAFSQYLPCQVQGTLLGASFSGFFFFFLVGISFSQVVS